MKHIKKGGEKYMTNKKTENATELTLATVQNMPIGQKITAYEQILNDQALFTRKLEEIRKKGDAVLEPIGKTFSDYLQKSDIKVPKKREVNPIISAFAQRVGNSISSALADGSTGDTTLEEYLGKESYAKLKAIANEYSSQRYESKEIDQKESEKVWQEYTKIRNEYQEARDHLQDADRRLEQANQYVSYVQKLAEVASKTKRLMQ
jgi:hypothetical protein